MALFELLGVLAMRKKWLWSAYGTCLLTFGAVSPTSAALIPVLGGIAVYDTDQDITWLANANAGAGSSFDDGSNTSDGRMSWSNANDWAASLDINGFTEWRLPNMDINGDGTVVDCATVSANECLDNEYGYHFYNNGIDSENTGIFNSVQTNNYWSSTEFSASDAWLFDFTVNDGSQVRTSKNLNASAWAVHEGNIGAVPLPATTWLFASGLISLTGIVIRKKL
jgi:hypothetical protein